MLEFSRLAILFHTSKVPTLAEPTGDVLACCAEIRNADSAEQLGMVYRQVPRTRWRRWFAPRTLAVHEADDAPLLCTLHQSWPFGRIWEVCDADDHVVGVWHPLQRRSFLWMFDGGVHWAQGVLRDRFGQLVSLLAPSSESAADWLFLQQDGTVLAVCTAARGRCDLAFAKATADNPILRMLLLAATLIEGMRIVSE